MWPLRKSKHSDLDPLKNESAQKRAQPQFYPSTRLLKLWIHRVPWNILQLFTKCPVGCKGKIPSLKKLYHLFKFLKALFILWSIWNTFSLWPDLSLASQLVHPTGVDPGPNFWPVWLVKKRTLRLTAELSNFPPSLCSGQSIFWEDY